jgi:hypothetical protein
MPDNYKASESENHTANILKQLDKFRFDTVTGMRLRLMLTPVAR